MLRAVIAVTLASVILAISLPAIEDARTTHTTDRVRADLADLAATANALAARNDPVTPGAGAARRTVSVRLPARSMTTAGVERVAIGGGDGAREPPDGDLLTWRLSTGRQGSLRVAVGLRAVRGGHICPDGTPLVLHRPGVHRLTLSLVRLGGEPVVLVRRGFKSENGTTPTHVRSVRAEGGRVSVCAGVRGRPPRGRERRLSRWR